MNGRKETYSGKLQEFRETVCRECFEYDEMRNFAMQSENTSPWQLFEIIKESRIYLGRKLELINELSSLTESDGEDSSVKEDLDRTAENIRKVLDMANDNTDTDIYAVTEHMYYNDHVTDASHMDELHECLDTVIQPSLEKAEEYMKDRARFEMDDEDVSDTGPFWFTVEKWRKKGDSTVLLAEYEYSSAGKLWGFSFGRDQFAGRNTDADVISDNDCRHSGKLLMKTPFRIGDIIVADVRPYADPALCVLHHKSGFCEHWVTFVEKDCIYVRTLENWPMNLPVMSPFIRAHRAAEEEINEILEGDSVSIHRLKSISSFLHDNPECGHSFDSLMSYLFG